MRHNGKYFICILCLIYNEAHKEIQQRYSWWCIRASSRELLFMQIPVIDIDTYNESETQNDNDIVLTITLNLH